MAPTSIYRFHRQSVFRILISPAASSAPREVTVQASILDRRSRSWCRLVWRQIHVMLAIFVISGCGDFVTVDTFEPITDPAQLFMKLTLNHKAINLALAD